MDSFYKDKLVLVTGGTGFVGSHFVERLLELGAKVRVPLHKRLLPFKNERIEIINANLMEQEDCLQACDQVDYVVHAAGAVSSAGVTHRRDAPLAQISINLNLTVQMLQAAWSKGTERFLLFSSSTGYPVANHPVKEDEFWNEPIYPNYFGYGWTRRYLERIGEYTHNYSNMKVAIVRPTAVFGERDDFNPHTGHVIPALIRRAVDKEDPFEVWGSPEVVRDFLHIDDLIEGSLLLLAKHPKCDPVNIGSGQLITIADIVNLIFEVTGHNAKIIFDESKPTTIPFRMVDISKAKQLLNFNPTISMREGLKRTVDWYIADVKNK